MSVGDFTRDQASFSAYLEVTPPSIAMRATGWATVTSCPSRIRSRKRPVAIPMWAPSTAWTVKPASSSGLANSMAGHPLVCKATSQWPDS